MELGVVETCEERLPATCAVAPASIFPPAAARPGGQTDAAYREGPPAYGILRCEVAPSSAGDTMWCGMVRAELATFFTMSLESP